MISRGRRPFGPANISITQGLSVGSKKLTSLRTSSKNSGEIENLAEACMRHDVVLVFLWGVVANQLEQPHLMVDDEENRVVLVEALVFKSRGTYVESCQ